MLDEFDPSEWGIGALIAAAVAVIALVIGGYFVWQNVAGGDPCVDANTNKGTVQFDKECAKGKKDGQ